MEDQLDSMPKTDQDYIEFCTLGMFIIDEIHFPPPTPPEMNIIGGAGSYSALGARLLSPSPKSNSVGWIIDCGSDFPAEIRETVAAWETYCLMRQTPDRLTTRGWNGYGENEHRCNPSTGCLRCCVAKRNTAFRYMTPKLRLDHESLDNRLLMSRSFHLICSPKRCIDLVQGITFRRNQLAYADPAQPPLFIWEPVPDLCTPEELKACLEALHLVDVVSPNHSELAAFFNVNAVEDGNVSKSAVKQCTDAWLASGIGSDGSGAVVVRAGKDGCYVATRDKERWIPPYHQLSEKVVDPTGGGNGFLGGLAIGLVRSEKAEWTSKVEDAAIRGSVAASLAIEQVGLPKLERHGESETWNGVDVFERLSEFNEKLEQYVQP